MRLGYSAMSMTLCLWATLSATSLAQKSDTSQQSATTAVLAPATVSTPVLITQTAPVTKQSSEPAALSWAEVIEQNPDPKVVTDPNLLQRIVDTKLPWRVKDKATGIEMLLVPPGKFFMGTTQGDRFTLDDEKPAHEVTLTKPFYLGRTEVTQAQWAKVVGNNPSHFHRVSNRDSMIQKLNDGGQTKLEAVTRAAKKSPDIDYFPVENITWNDCQQFCAKTKLRLPTEAEWEYACRAGVQKPAYGALDNIAWNNSNSNGTTHKVGQKIANSLGFYDMLGNVYEWCVDIYGQGYYKNSENGVVDPKGPSDGLVHVHRMRGGDFRSTSFACRSAFRGYFDPINRDIYIGFRVARTP